ncbi:hypothetical protein [Asticcacaulis sp. AC402]|uniref:hypothetical protein n=1 Tax=Asticcacaulis sp. AC402 TaxID=1282361 RepID=UPI0012DD2071|nr:hypothetical protein [Asticcacaulis sp. AC402]
MAIGDRAQITLRPAVVLFGTMLAVTLARAFSEVLANAIRTGDRILTFSAMKMAWAQSLPSLIVATPPTLLILVFGLGLYKYSYAVFSAQVYCIAILIIIGARAGWAIRPRSWMPLAGATFVGSIGAALALLKYTIH